MANSHASRTPINSIANLSKLKDCKNVNKRAPLGEKDILQLTNTPRRPTNQESTDWKFTIFKSHNSIPKCQNIGVSNIKNTSTMEPQSASTKSDENSFTRIEVPKSKKRKWKWKMDTVPMPQAKRIRLMTMSSDPTISEAVPTRLIAIPRTRVPV